MVNLQKVIDELLLLHAETRQVHWNAKGRGFIALHKYLDEAYDYLTDYMDVVAERMRALDQTPDGTVGRKISTGRAQLAGDEIFDYKEAVAHLVKTYKNLSTQMQEMAEDSEDDLATQDMLIEGIRELDKTAWLFKMEIE